MYELVASGEPSELINLDDYQSLFNEGDKGYLDLHLSSELPFSFDRIVDQLDSHLANRFDGYRLERYPSLLRIRFKVAIPPLVIIAIAFAVVVVIIGFVVAWKLYKLSPTAFMGFSVVTIIAIVLGIIAVLIVITAIRKLI